MLKIRLKRLGKKKKACYRIIAIDSRNKRDGKALDELGFYNPINKQVNINLKKIITKIEEGAQTTQIVQKIIDKYK